MGNGSIAERLGVMFEQLGRIEGLTLLCLVVGIAAAVLAANLIWSRFFEEGLSGRIGMSLVIVAVIAMPFTVYVDNIGRPPGERVTLDFSLPSVLMFVAAFFLLLRMTYRKRERQSEHMRNLRLSERDIGDGGGMVNQ